MPDVRKRKDPTSEEDSKTRAMKKNPEESHYASVYKTDGGNIALLLFLYVLQGIPLGLAAAIPFVLSQKEVTYRQQAEFSFSFWPFSVKLLWAPIVDSIYSSAVGRRKTWLVPTQFMIGVAMYVLSATADGYLETKNVAALTAAFFFLNFLAATQDIAVDGWALTMLRPENVGYASTCNSVGQTAGYFLGYGGYIAGEAHDITTLSGFLFFWSIVFFVATALVAVLKSEKVDEEESKKKQNDDNLEAGKVREDKLGILGTFKLLYKILQLKNMKTMVLVLLTAKIGFAATDSATSLKLIEAGVSRDSLVLLAIPMAPIQILLPLLVSRYTAGAKPMDIFLTAAPYRLAFGLIFAAFIWVTPKMALGEGHFPVYYYAILLVIYALHQVTVNCMFVAVMAFFSRISDPAVGGTYMTLLNTLTNLGGNWSATLALWFLDQLTVKECVWKDAMMKRNVSEAQMAEVNCSGKSDSCSELGGKCEIQIEGYYLETFICVAIGFAWLVLWGRKAILRLQALDLSEWRVAKPLKQR